MLSADTLALAARVLEACRTRSLTVVLAESCTGGLVSAALTHVAGASAIVERGLVTYSNAAKRELLGVEEAALAAHGAVSREVALAMAAGALACSPAALAVAVTGIAGPDGGSAEKPVGLVWFATARRDGPAEATSGQFAGDRAAIRADATKRALDLLRERATMG